MQWRNIVADLVWGGVIMMRGAWQPTSHETDLLLCNGIWVTRRRLHAELLLSRPAWSGREKRFAFHRRMGLRRCVRRRGRGRGLISSRFGRDQNKARPYQTLRLVGASVCVEQFWIRFSAAMASLVVLYRPRPSFPWPRSCPWPPPRCSCPCCSCPCCCSWPCCCS
jgi:hypothetical protein